MCAGTGVGIITSEKRFPERNAICASEESREAVSKPDVKYGEGIKSEEIASEDNGCACCRRSLKVELLERADRLSVEVSVLSLREGRSRR